MKTLKKFIRMIKCAINKHEFMPLAASLVEFCKHCLETKTINDENK